MTTKLISRCLTPANRLSGILSLIGFGNLSVPRPFSALPPAIFCKASPKAISGRTSYLRVRLEFLRYPHLIRQLFNDGRFGPPWRFTATSPWTWIGHSVSGPIHATSRPFQTRFPFGSGPQALNLAAWIRSPDRSTKSTTSRVDALCVLVSTRFQVLFTPLPGCFSPFLHSTLRYRSPGSIQAWRVVPPVSHRVSRVRWYSGSSCLTRLFAYGALTLCGRPSHAVRLKLVNGVRCPQPRKHCCFRFGLFRVRSPLLAESRLISFPRPT